MNQMILVVVDASSKWTEAINTSGATISKVYGIFFTHGLPELLFMDSGIHKNYVKHSSIFSSIKWSDRERFEGREERHQENKKKRIFNDQMCLVLIILPKKATLKHRSKTF